MRWGGGFPHVIISGLISIMRFRHHIRLVHSSLCDQYWIQHSENRSYLKIGQVCDSLMKIQYSVLPNWWYSGNLWCRLIWDSSLGPSTEDTGQYSSVLYAVRSSHLFLSYPHSTDLVVANCLRSSSSSSKQSLQGYTEPETTVGIFILYLLTKWKPLDLCIHTSCEW